MWSGGAPQWASWPVQEQKIQNMNHEEVDWASLAKQWIQMKENVCAPPPPPPLPPDPPTSSNTLMTSASAHAAFIPTEIEPPSGGEMDMEIEDEKETNNTVNASEILAPSNTQPQMSHNNGEVWSGWWNENVNQTEGSHWGWNWPVESAHSDNTLPPDVSTTYRDVPEYKVKPREAYTWVAPSLDQHHSSSRQYGYSKKSSRNRSHYEDSSSKDVKMPDFDLDAAQRKKLPLWIREGLEKMEREKQRKLDRERELELKEELLRNKKEAERNAQRMMLQENLRGEPHVPVKSKFESDSGSESDTDGRNDDKSIPPPVPIIKNAEEETTKSVDDQEPPLVVLSPEEQMKLMMLKLRRWMTEILLDVTSSMIREVAEEVVEKSRKRASTVQVKKPNALSSLSGNSGLIMYSDSESDSEDGASRTQTRGYAGQETSDDSDEELRRNIERKKVAFEATERAILHKLQRQEEAANRVRKKHSENGDHIAHDSSDEEEINRVSGSSSHSDLPKTSGSFAEKESKITITSISGDENIGSGSEEKSESLTAGDSKLESASQSVSEMGSVRSRSRSHSRRRKDHKKSSKDSGRHGHKRSHSRDRIARRRSRSRSHSKDRTVRRRSRSSGRHDRRKSRERKSKRKSRSSSLRTTKRSHRSRSSSKSRSASAHRSRSTSKNRREKRRSKRTPSRSRSRTRKERRRSKRSRSGSSRRWRGGRRRSSSSGSERRKRKKSKRKRRLRRSGSSGRSRSSS